jgi:nucleoside-diphosphate-sugar epimerase
MTVPHPSWVGRRVAVTGAGGFLGRRLVERLSEEGAHAMPLGRSTGFSLLEDDFPPGGIDYVFHLAAETGVPDAWDDPVRFHLVNSHGTVRVLDQCRKRGAGLTYVGAYIYGVPQVLPISERHPVDPNNPYAFSNWMGEQACRWYADTYGLPVTAIRLFNVYGPGQSERFLVGRVLAQVLDPEVHEIRLLDLAPRRDYLFVDDAVEALLSSAATGGFNLFNVGSGRSHSVAEVAQSAMAAAGIEKPVSASGEVRQNEIPDVVADCGALRSATGWAPRHTLDTGIGEMLRSLAR